jgi:hypothetical protein
MDLRRRLVRIALESTLTISSDLESTDRLGINRFVDISLPVDEDSSLPTSERVRAIQRPSNGEEPIDQSSPVFPNTFYMVNQAINFRGATLYSTVD